MSMPEVLSAFKADKAGLTLQEVGKRRARYGRNELPRERAPGPVRIFFRQFLSPLVVILVAAAFVSIALGELLDAGVIAAAVLVNTIIGFAQEFKATSALEKLHRLVDPHAIVLRNGVHASITAGELVPGDILVLRAGDKVSADARLLEAVQLSVNEAVLTGESIPVEKITRVSRHEAALAERACMVFAGTHIVGGRGLAVVIATGTATELGHIAKLVEPLPVSVEVTTNDPKEMLIKNSNAIPYQTIVALAESPRKAGLMYVGSDDGRLHTTIDSGKEWTELTSKLPARKWFSRLVPSIHAEGAVYVTQRGREDDDFSAYIYKSVD